MPTFEVGWDFGSVITFAAIFRSNFQAFAQTERICIGLLAECIKEIGFQLHLCDIFLARSKPNTWTHTQTHKERNNWIGIVTSRCSCNSFAQTLTNAIELWLKIVHSKLRKQMPLFPQAKNCLQYKQMHINLQQNKPSKPSGLSSWTRRICNCVAVV